MTGRLLYLLYGFGPHIQLIGYNWVGFLLQSKNIQSSESLISWDLDSPLGANFQTRIIYQLRQGNVGERRNGLGVSQNRFTLFSVLTWGFPDMAIHQLDGGNGHVLQGY